MTAGGVIDNLIGWLIDLFLQLRIGMGVLRGGERADRHQRRRHHREHLACRRLPQDRPFLFHQSIHVFFFL